MSEERASLRLKAKESILTVTVSGRFNQEAGLAFIKAYQLEVRGMPQRTELKMDCRKLEVTAADVIPLLQQCCLMYKRDFLSVSMYIDRSDLILRKQIERTAAIVGLAVSVEEVAQDVILFE